MQTTMAPQDAEFIHEGVRLAYRSEGDGSLLLILPGNTASSVHHAGELAHFSRRFRAVAPDFAGTGRSARLAVWPDDWYQRCAHAMAALVAHLGARQCIAVGTSGGAIVALWLAILHAEIVRAVVADSTVSAYPPAWLHAGMDTRAARTLGQVQFWQAAHGDDWAQVVEQDTAMLRRIADRGGSLFDDRLSGMRTPVLITASLGDTMLPTVGESQLALLAQIPDSRLFLAKAGDHPLMWSNAGEFRRAVDAFLRDL